MLLTIVFILRSTRASFDLTLYIDDVLLAGTELGMIHETRGYFENSFDMKDTDGVAFVIKSRYFKTDL